MLNQSELAARTDESEDCENADAEPPNLVLEFETNSAQQR